MPWIKRNLFFVISLAVGLILTGYCAFMFYQDLGSNSQTSSDYQDKKNQLADLQKKQPYPSEENIKLAQADQKRVADYMADFRKVFVQFPPQQALDESGFHRYLAQTLTQLRTAATNNGVQLAVGSSDFGFGFTAQEKKPNYAPENIQPWMQQLVEIKALSEILFRAKINFLESLQRVKVSDNDFSENGEMIDARSVTNQTQVATPYKISFRSFSTEIADVLEGLARSSNCFVVKNIVVSPSSYVVPAPSTPTPAVVAPVIRQTGDQGGGYDQRNDPRAKAFSRRNEPAPQPTASPTGAPVTVLSEKPLHVTISVDVVRLK